MKKLPNFVAVAMGALLFAAPFLRAETQSASAPVGAKGATAQLQEGSSSKIDPFLKSARRLAERPNVDLGSVAQSCLALTAAQRLAPASETQALLVKTADLLVTQKDLNADGRVGWGVPESREKHKKCPVTGMLDAFGDGTCNSVNTEYTFQTGLAVMCLAQVFDLTKEERFKVAAVQALNDSWKVGAHAAGCPDCFYYWYSYSPNDIGRYVRNTNALMGASAAWVWKISGDRKFRDRALEVAKSELRELAAGNDGYFGIDDRRYKENARREAQRIENHVPWVSKGLSEIGNILSEDSIKRAALRVQDSWQFCKDAFTCKDKCDTWAADPERCANSVTVSPCFHKSSSRKYAELCEIAKQRAGATLNSYQFWAIYGQ
jgi:hypothetical protein